jgi:hypothetical protein
MHFSLSPRTRRVLIHFANATKFYQQHRREIDTSDGTNYKDIHVRIAVDEYFRAKQDLLDCPEPEIVMLVEQLQLERIDEAMKISADKAIQADSDAMLAKQELVRMGQRLIDGFNRVESRTAAGQYLN